MMSFNIGISQKTFHSEYIFPNDVICDDSGIWIDSMQIVLAISADSSLYLGVGYDGVSKTSEDGTPEYIRDLAVYQLASAYSMNTEGGPTTLVFCKEHQDGNISTFRLIKIRGATIFVQNSVWGDISYICEPLQWGWELPSYIQMGVLEYENN